MFNSVLSCGVGYRGENICEIYRGNCHSDPHHHKMIQNAGILLLSDPDAFERSGKNPVFPGYNFLLVVSAVDLVLNPHSPPSYKNYGDEKVKDT